MKTKTTKKPMLRYGMRVRVSDKDNFYYGLTGTLTSADPEAAFVYIELDLEMEEEDQDSHPIHMDNITPMKESDPDYEGIHFEDDDEDEEIEEGEEWEIEESPLPIPLTGVITRG